jgi:hypothetical protein
MQEDGNLEQLPRREYDDGFSEVNWEDDTDEDEAAARNDRIAHGHVKRVTGSNIRFGVVGSTNWTLTSKCERLVTEEEWACLLSGHCRLVIRFWQNAR